jgi:hypothetical protein
MKAQSRPASRPNACDDGVRGKHQHGAEGKGGGALAETLERQARAVNDGEQYARRQQRQQHCKGRVVGGGRNGDQRGEADALAAAECLRPQK